MSRLSLADARHLQGGFFFLALLELQVAVLGHFGARDGPRELSDRADCVETKGFLMRRVTAPTLAFVYKRSFICDV